MPDDDRDFIERANSVAEKIHGEPMTTEEIAKNFALYGLQKRAASSRKIRHRTARRDQFQSAQTAPARAVDGAAQEDGRRSRGAAQGKAIDATMRPIRKSRARRVGAGADARCADVCEMVRAEWPVALSCGAGASRAFRRRIALRLASSGFGLRSRKYRGFMSRSASPIRPSAAWRPKPSAILPESIRLAPGRPITSSVSNRCPMTCRST